MQSDATEAHSATMITNVGEWYANSSAWILRGVAALGAIRAAQLLAASGRLGPIDAATVAEAAYQGVAHAVAGLLLAAPVRALGVWVERGVAGATAGEPASGPARSTASPSPLPPADETRSHAAEAAAKVAEVRRLIREGEWEAADERAHAFAAEQTADPRGPALLEELERSRRDAADRWREQLRAAREVNDAARVLELYEGAPPVLDDPSRRELDRELAGWFLSSVHRRLRSGLLQVEVVTLVERVSSTFGHTKEGASLRAALPTLRRGAGLCARCGKPYAGLADACPACLGAPEPPPPFIPELEPVDEIETPPARDEESSWFLDPEDEPEAGDPGPDANGRLRP
ncbi:hypothetical protein [Paludisphaera soli]|uniref:hypothetical protein n=1 Tax=Paludisphaera soli TaxID=2712865 RepID=UPI0013EDBBF2|nr:hypothetical protein [Paludisphaera soli]